ncbi:MAG TPA: BON domain-containing protein [Steroidobacteraceae bacterium]|nr:BON domain-containing protein [Steroidobacteraceae bacterium]
MIKSRAMLVAALAAGTILGGCVTTQPSESNAQAIDDSTITANVKSALIQDPSTRARNISVNTLRGTVELSGFVDSTAERHEAANIASRVAGVRSVENQLQINGETRTTAVGTFDDQTITSNVRAALAANPETATPRIKVSTADGVVQLAGFVDSNEQRATATRVASTVPGVRSVDNDLRLTPQG